MEDRLQRGSLRAPTQGQAQEAPAGPFQAHDGLRQPDGAGTRFNNVFHPFGEFHPARQILINYDRLFLLASWLGLINVKETFDGMLDFVSESIEYHKVLFPHIFLMFLANAWPTSFITFLPRFFLFISVLFRCKLLNRPPTRTTTSETSSIATSGALGRTPPPLFLQTLPSST